MQQDLEVDRVTKRYGAPHGRRRAVARGRARQLLLHPRPLGLRQDDAAADDRRLPRARRRRRPHRRPLDARRGAEPAAGQHGVPAPRAVPDDDRSARTSVTASRAAASRAPRSPSASRRCWSASACPARRTSASTSSPAGRSSAWRSRAASCSSRRCCCSTSRSARSISKLREHMKIELKQLQADFGTTFVYITHDQSEALVLSDHVAVMNAGRFEQVGTPQELYYQPRTPFVAGFVGANNRIAGRATRVDGDVVEIATGDGLDASARARAARSPSATAVEAFVRPEVVALARDAAELAARARSVSRARREPAVRRRQLGGAGARDDARAPRSASRCRRPDASPTSRSARRSRSASTRSAPSAFAARSLMAA